MASLLLIGGTGFFGKSFIDAKNRGILKKYGIDKLIILSRNLDNFKKNYNFLIKEGTVLYPGDITKIDNLPDSDFIIHAAASTDSNLYINNSNLELQNIKYGINNFLNLLKNNHHRKILYVSSGAVYGAQPSNVANINENDTFSIKNLTPDKVVYANGKIYAENLIKEMVNSRHLFSIARCFSFIGRFLPLESHFVLGNFLYSILHNIPIEVKSSKFVYRSYMHSDDLVEWLIEIMLSSNSSCPTYNVGSDEEFEIRDLAELLSKKYSIPLKINKNISDNVDRYIPSIKKAQNELGLKIKHKLEYSIDRTLNEISHTQIL